MDNLNQERFLPLETSTTCHGALIDISKNEIIYAGHYRNYEEYNHNMRNNQSN